MSGLNEELLAPANGIELAYQEIGDPDGEPLLLIMGLAMQMLGWHEGFCELLADRGFRVIRFDNRDIGHSTMLDHLGVASRFDIFSGRRSTAPYMLADMAEDTFGLLDHLEIESAHVVGASMGGMIAQTMAIQRPDRVRSLVSMLSTTGNRWLGVPALKAWGLLFAAHPRVEADYVDRGIKTFRIIGSPRYPMDREFIAERACAMYARSHNPAGILRQTHAISASGDRTPALRRLDLPATVLHGSADPLMRPAGARATAKAIPGARLRMFEGMGHDLPRELWPDFVEEIAATAALGMRLKGVEPSRALAHTDLNRARLPVPPQPREQAI
jgi:pimeloyl-ACP methyl ester carboxylesterase